MSKLDQQGVDTYKKLRDSAKILTTVTASLQLMCNPVIAKYWNISLSMCMLTQKVMGRLKWKSPKLDQDYEPSWQKGSTNKKIQKLIYAKDLKIP